MSLMPLCPAPRQLMHFCVVLGASKPLHQPTSISLPSSLAPQPSNDEMLNMLKALQSKLEETETQRKKEAERVEAQRKKEAERVEAQRKKEAERVEARWKKEAERVEAQRRRQRELKRRGRGTRQMPRNKTAS